MAILALSALDLTAVCLSALLILPLSSILYWTARLLRNYLAARRMSPGLPIIVIPIDHTNRLWSIIDRQCLSFLDRFIPFWSIKRTVLWRYNVRGWEIPERYHTHRKLGDVFAMVSPSRIWLYVGDPDAATEVLKRGNDFPRCLELTEILNVFGPNISTVEGSRWKVQRKIMQSCFNEPNNEIVWSEAVSQGTDMLQYWTKSQARTSSSPSPSLSSSGVATIADDLRTLSLHVLSRAGFGKSSKFQGYDEVQKKKKETSGMSDASDGGGGSDWYRDSLQVILENCILIMVLGPEFLAKPWLPRRLGPLQLGQVHQACVSFQGYMREMYEEGKRRLPNADGFHGGASSATKEKGFMASLVRASQEEGGGGGDNGLTEGEIYGNMFVLNFAGHDTITHTITFGVYFLAIYPNMQAWLAEELRAVLGTRPPNEWSYTADFPRLKRCLAVLLETLRLYNPIPLGKWTGENTVSLSVGDRRLVIPPKTMVCPSYSSLQTDPKYWGYVSLEWRPQRWIETTGPDGEEMVKTPRRGTFLPWSEGVRDCPGKKFSQIEFVATMASLFRDWRVDPACLPGEDLRAARLRVSTQIRTDSWPVLLLQMLHPEKAPLVWSRR